MNIKKTNKTVVIPKPKSDAKFRLICFPYAGGGAGTYFGWDQWLSDDVELLIVQPAGRGSRLKESPATSMTDLVADIFDGLAPYLDKPFAFFGHSMGCLVAYELALALKQKQMALPKLFVVSACRAPQIQYNGKKTDQLSDQQFIDILDTMADIPPALAQSKRLIQMCLPMLRADFQIAEQYHNSSVNALDCQFIAFAGQYDNGVDMDDYHGWSQQFASEGSLSMFAGDHYFVEQVGQSVVEHINTAIAELVPSTQQLASVK